MMPSRALTSTTVLLLASGTAFAANPSFHILGSEQYEFYPHALSGDGNRVVGMYQVPPSDLYQPVYMDWRTAPTPTILQGSLSPTAVSFDGSVIVGVSNSGPSHPFRWINGNLTHIAPPDGAVTTDCKDVSGDGSTIVCQAYQTGVGNSGAKWNATTGWSFLPHLATSNCSDASANAISGNGNVIAGSAHHCGGYGTAMDYEAVTWNPQIAALGWSRDAFATVANKVSADGYAVVGYRAVALGSGYMSPVQYTACRWTSAGVDYLFPPAGTTYAGAHDVSGDGRTVVGRYEGGAFIWYENGGLFDLTQMAIAVVGDLDGWTLTNATAISDDSSVIIGWAEKNGHLTTFVLDLGVPCIADYVPDGIVDFFDYVEFLQDFSQGNMNADVNHDRVLDLFDYLDFVQVFSTGCQ